MLWWFQCRICFTRKNPRPMFEVLKKSLKVTVLFGNYFAKSKLKTIQTRFIANMAVKKEFKRLPTDVTPVNYNLWLRPSLEKLIFDGKEDIEVKVNESTNEVTMNSSDIKISSVTYCGNNGTILESSDISFNVDQEKVTVKFPEALEKGKGVISILFQGELNNKMKGFYRSKYTNAAGEDKFCAVTQFEATDARRAFPCWDEPNIKATFDVTLVVPKDKVALSNMNVISETEYIEDANLSVVKYAQTPIMSTYLLAFVVGEFDYVEDSTKNGVKVRVYTPLGKSEQGKFGLDVAVKALQHYEEYFNIKYPLPKLDLIAIADFSAGAMENWGLVTYRETALLIDEANSSAHSRQWVALVVCHELAHQWFGNLVTMQWWTHLWLNEGFASFMEYLATDHCHPKFDIWTQFLSHDFMRAVDLDALDNSHPIEVPVGHPDEVDEIFDIISYSKGASVIRMLHDWIGDETFRKGMHMYLSKWAYKNAYTEDLWAALGEASGKPVEKVMSTWTKQMGFPVLDVSLKSRTDTSVTLAISQKKFQANQSKVAVDGESPLWMIPISFSTSESPDSPVKTILMEGATTEVTIDVPRDSWIKVNPGCYGFYRVRYSSELLNALLPAVKDRTLQARDRLSLQNDIFALASSGVTSTTDFLNVMSAYESETNYTVWNDLNSNISSISNLLWQGKPTHDKFKQFVLNLTGKIHAYLGWEPKENESHLDAMLRAMIIARRGSYGCKDVIAQARTKLDEHLEGKQTIPADLRGSVYASVLSHAEEKDLNKMINYHNSADLHEEKVRIERCIGAVSDENLQKKVLEFAMSDNVRMNDRVFVIGSVASGSRSGRDITWNFVKDNWKELYEAYKGMFLMSRLVKSCSESFTTQDEANEVEEFFKKNPPAAAERTVQQALENIRLKHDWWQRDGAAIAQWLADKS